MGELQDKALESGRRDEAQRSAGFVGREPELRELSAGLSEALAGRGRVFLIVGEPGIGKTRLAAELSALASRSGARVLWGRCWEGEGAPAYWPWVQMIRGYLRDADAESLARDLGSGASYVAQMVPEIGEWLGPIPPPPTSTESEHARFRLFDAVACFLTKAADRRPLVLVLDDAHWADKSSLLLLQLVARELRQAAILLVATCREVDARQSRDVMDLLGVIGREARHLPLRGLGEAEVGQVIEGIAGRPPTAALTRQIRQATEGNPFFVDELVRLLALEGRLGVDEPPAVSPSPVPRGVREAIRRRLSPLSEESRRVLSVASVVGRDFDLAVLQAACTLPVESLLALLGEAQSAGVVAETSVALGQFAFSHALLRETLYDDLGPAERARTHRDVGEALEGLYRTNPEPHLAELAHHFLRAGSASEPGKTIELVIRAARRASLVLAHDDAAALYERAAQLLDLLPEREKERGDVQASLGEALSRAGEPARARNAFRRAAEIARQRGDSAGLTRAALGFGGGGFGGIWAVSRAQDEGLVSLLEEAAVALGTSDDVLRAKVLARLATALHYTPERERRESLAREAVEVARRTNDAGALAYALAARHYALCGPGDVEERLEIADEILRIAERSGDPELALFGRGWRIVDLLELGDLSRAGSEIEIHARFADELRQPFHSWYATMWRAMHATASGRFEDAERLARQAFEIGRRAQEENAAHTFTVQQITLCWLQGRFEEPIRESERGVAEYPGMAGWRYSLALSYAKAGRHDEARRELERVARVEGTELTHGASRLLLPAFEAMTVALLGDAGRAAALYERFLPHARLAIVDGHEADCWHGSVAHYLGLLAATMGRSEAAVDHFGEAIAVHERAGSRPMLAESLHACARALLDRAGPGDPAAALARIDRALGIATELGMADLAERARATKVRANEVGGAAPDADTARSAEAAAWGEVTASAPRGTVTLMFSDMEGFTEMTERLGDALALEVVRTHNGIVREEVKAHGGSELELQGDGFLLAFPAAGSAVRCAVAIQRALADHCDRHPDRPIRVRMGIHTGEPIREADRFFGKSVILAARIAAEARGGEILVSSVVKDLCETLPEARFDRGREVELKGLAGVRTVFRVTWNREEGGPAISPADESARAQDHLFRREGEFWTIAYDGRTIRLKDSKGLRYLAELLRNPGRELHVSSLVGEAHEGAGGERGAGTRRAAAGLGDAGTILDTRAKAEYRRRLEDLRETVEEAERFHDVERAARAREEIDVLGRELAHALGLGGRDRKAASNVERARLNVTLAIRSALRRIAEQSPSLGRHLDTTIRTGKFCAYAPDPRVPIEWIT